MNIADDLVRAFNDGYEKGKADAEAYLLHCGDTDEPQTNADRIRSMTDEELAELIGKNDAVCPPLECPIPNDVCNPKVCWLVWMKEEAKE